MNIVERTWGQESRSIATIARCMNTIATGQWKVRGSSKEFLLSFEDTAVDLSLLRQFANLLVVGAVPFSTYAKSYNRRFGYLNKLDTADDFSVDEKESTIKRKIR